MRFSRSCGCTSPPWQPVLLRTLHYRHQHL
jgi:hypothetical protein